MKKHALIVAGGWSGHQPEQVARLLAEALAERNFSTRIETDLEILADRSTLDSLDVLVPCWTMGSLTDLQTKSLTDAVRDGLGLAGCHGGMGDAFRGNLDYEWMVGGHFVGHPHVGDYTVRRRADHPAMRQFPEVLAYRSEQYYMLIDPAIEVLADTEYTYEGHTCTMPVVWTKTWGRGRVFYSALGHALEEFNHYPAVLAMTADGIAWAARSP
ncbi:MAG: ThuA domain-containing protein [Candidatus Methylacidiphilales bacterium]